MTTSISPSWNSLASWLSDQQGATMNQIFFVTRIRIDYTRMDSSMRTLRDRNFLAYLQLLLDSIDLVLLLFCSLILVLLLIVYPFMAKLRPSYTNTGFTLFSSNMLSIRSRKSAQLQVVDSWMSESCISITSLQQPLYSQGKISIPTVLLRNLEICYLLTIGFNKFSRPSIPILFVFNMTSIISYLVYCAF